MYFYIVVAVCTGVAGFIAWLTCRARLRRGLRPGVGVLALSVLVGLVAGWLAGFREILFYPEAWKNPKLALATLLLISAVPSVLAATLLAGAFVARGQRKHARTQSDRDPGV